MCVIIVFLPDCISQSAFARLHFALCVFFSSVVSGVIVVGRRVAALVLVLGEGVGGVGKIAGGF